MAEPTPNAPKPGNKDAIVTNPAKTAADTPQPGTPAFNPKPDDQAGNSPAPLPKKN